MKSNSDRIMKHFLKDAIMNGAEKVQEDGGPGSGNFGHKGRPGLRGGSGKGEGSAALQTVGAKPTGMRLNPTQNRAHIRSDIAKYRVKAQQTVNSFPEKSQDREWAEEGLNALQSSSKRPTPEETKTLQGKMLGNISNQLKPYAQEKYIKSVKAEPQITSDLMDICDATGAEMYGLVNRLKKASDNSKGVCRIEEKIQGDIKEAAAMGITMTYEEAVDKLSDIVRYTQACTVDNLADQFEATRKALEAKGYKCLKVKNSWDSFNKKNPYRGVNTVFQSPDGTKFELQFHTPESMFTKTYVHGMYEIARTDSTPEETKAALNERMLELYSAMERPKNVERVKLSNDRRRVWR